MNPSLLTEEEIFRIAHGISSPDLRSGYLKQVCGENSQLFERVVALLNATAEDESFLENPPEGMAPTIDSRPITEKPGDVIGSFKLLQKIGEGGFGVVYMADQVRPVRRKVALKVIKPGMDTKEVIARFEAERQALAMMNHPNIAKVLDGGETESGRPYFVMELVNGIPLTKFCDDQKLNTKERLQLFMTVCSAIQHAHQKGVIHRDIKPSNIMITLHDGQPAPKVIDFGVSKAINQQLTERTLFTSYGQMVGTPQYMSPEQAEMTGLDVDTRSDIYSLGVVLYELLTGTTPLEAEKLRTAGFVEMQRLIKEQEAPKPSSRVSGVSDRVTAVAKQRGISPDALRQSLRGDLDWVVMKAIDKDRNRRYDSASRFAEDIQRHLNSEMVEARPPSIGYQLSKFYQRNKAFSQGTLAVVAALLVGLIGISALYLKLHATSLTLESTNASLSALLMDDAVTAALSGDNAKATKSIKFIEDDELYAGDVLLIRALIELNEGNYPKASEFARKSLAQNSHFQAESRVGAFSIVAAAEMWGSIDLPREAISQLLSSETESDFEALLKAYACAVIAPELSLEMVEKFPNAFSSSVGLFVIGQALYLDAVNRGDKDAFGKAVSAVEWATSQMGEAENAINLRVLTLSIAIQYAQQQRDKERVDRLIAEAQPWVEKLKRAGTAWCHVHLFYRVVGDAIESQEACKSESGQYHCEHVFAECLLQTSNYVEAESLFNEIVDNKDSQYIRMNKAHVVRGCEGGKRRVLGLVSDIKFENSFDSRLRLYALSLACNEDELETFAREVADRFRDEHYREDELWRDADSIRYLAGDLDEQQLTDLARGHRYTLTQMYCSIAFKYLARGDRETAKLYFQKAVDTDTVGSSDYAIAYAYLHRMHQDDSWPQWLNESE